MKNIKNEVFSRELNIKRSAIDEENRTVEVAFSSESAVERYFGNEILSHEEGSADLSRLNSGGAVLVEHDTRDHVGVIESARIDADKRGRAVLRFSRSARGEEVFQDVLDGIRNLVSFGYRISKYDEVEVDGVRTVTATKWIPHEVSLVSVPADASVGVGRSQELTNKEIKTMSKDKVEDKQERKIEAPAVDVKAETERTRKQELDRINSIRQMGEEHDLGDLARKAIDDGVEQNDFYRSVLDEIGKRNTAERAKEESKRGEEVGQVGLSDKEKREFSFVRLMDALSNPNDRHAANLAGFELEVCAAAERDLPSNFNVRGTYIPSEVIARDLSAGTATDGAELVGTNLLSGSYIDALRNNMVAMNAGVTMLSGLVGNVDIPRQTSGASATWISAEDGDATESEPQFDQVSMTPKDLAAYTEITRRLSMQSTPAAEAIVRNDLFKAIALGLDSAVYYGSGASGQPQGIDGATGVDDPTFVSATAPTYAEMVTQMADIMRANGGSNLSYIGSPEFYAAMITTPKQGSGVEGNFISDGSSILGRNFLTSTQLTANDFVLGDFSQVLMGEWGGLELNVDPYTNSLKGRTRYIVFKTVDLAIRHPEAFSFHNAA